MKRIPIILALILCLGLGWLAGHTSYTVPSLAFLADHQQAKFYDFGLRTTPDNFIGTIDVSELMPLFATATWRSGGVKINKGEFHLIVDDGTHIRWRAPGTYFLVDGWPGHFVFPESKQESIRSYLGQLLDDTIIPQRQKRNAQPDAAPEPPPAAAVLESSETMNPKPQSDAPADDGGR